MELHHRVAQAAMTDAYTELDRLISGFEDADFQRATRCAGWIVSDVVFHLMLDAQRALVAFSSQVKGKPDVDHLSYWRNHASNRTAAEANAHGRFVRIAASAYPTPGHLVQQWQETARAVSAVAGYAPGPRVIETRGRLMTITDLLGTLAVEATIRHMDMLLELPGKPPPRPGAIEFTVSVLDGLLGAGVERPEWHDQIWILKATGREPLSGEERLLLDETVERFPLLG